MKISETYTPNLPVRAGRMTKGKFSVSDLSSHVSYLPQNKYLKEKPLKQYSRELSFKGFSLSNVKVDDAAAVLEKVGKVLGSTFERKYALLSDFYPKRIIKNGNSIEFVRKSVFQMVGESLSYPLVKMPFDLANFGLNILKKVPGVKKIANSMYNSKFLSSKRLAAIREEEFNSVMGMFDQVSKKMKDPAVKNIDEWIFNLSQKYFSPSTGKYNTVHERALNRIVSGIIPAFFLANDAYNLSRYCDDKQDLAQKEHKTRFKQEVSRVGITAYIQLVILGGLTKFVNSSLIGTALSSTIPVLISETSSRLMNGKSITFISKDKAKQMAKEQGVIKIKDEESDKNELIYKYYPMPVAFSRTEKAFMAFKGARAKMAFNSFIPQNVVDQTAGLVEKVTTKRDIENQKNKKNNAILTVDMLKKAIVASIAVGFGLKLARKNASIDKAFNTFFGIFKENYSRLVKRDYVIGKAEFGDIISKLKKAGFDEIANKYVELMNTHSEDTTKLVGLLQDMLKKIKTPEYASIVKANEAILKKYGIKPNVSKKHLSNSLERLKNTPTEMYKLGQIDKKIKPAVDFVIAPFKFIWATLKFPYTIVNNIVSLALGSKKAVKNSSVIETMTKSLMDIQENAKKLSSAEFKDYIEKTMCLSFNNTSKSDYSNADLGKLTKLFASTVTTWFLIADDYNMVMMKSLGQDEAGASLKAKERFQQRITGIFYQTLFIDLFNNTFRKLYHASLLGMSAVTGACTFVCEIFTRKSIGKPVSKMSRDEINELEYKNIHAPGLKGKYFRFMTDLTGKKAVSADASKKKIKANA